MPLLPFVSQQRKCLPNARMAPVNTPVHARCPRHVPRPRLPARIRSAAASLVPLSTRNHRDAVDCVPSPSVAAATPSTASLLPANAATPSSASPTAPVAAATPPSASLSPAR
ncbi:hypothetical protein B0H17DRAFT_1191403 [Mycena rosella]|uniref:Uncharacterized protein n=1 Tax=Mycena rosella TaxID=1033263 RepID=A0AAD7H065_MYCRO|nr:hypothetical protein B0H17DRAFT_1191403 [Mycena rosella]